MSQGSRFRRSSLRRLLVLFTCLALVLGYVGTQRYRVQQQAIAIRQIEVLGGTPRPINLRDGIPYNVSGNLPAPTQKKWMYWVFGEDYFTYVPLIELRNASAQSIQAMVPCIHQLRLKEGLNEAGQSYIAIDLGGNPNIDKELLDYIASDAPECKVLFSDPRRNGAYQ